MKDIFKGKKILITGGAGSVGRALTERVLEYSPETVRIFDISENELFKMRNDFKDDPRIRYLIGDIRDVERLKLAMEEIDIVIHLAAMKHVYACEYNPFEAVKTNIDGLQNVINVARNHDAEMVVFSSTDKAAAPFSVMGMTKLLAEKLIALANYYKGNKRTVFTSVRFGNVIGSNGSVVPLFKKQILDGGPLTITDKAMTRFVITMDEAIDLIFSAIRLAKGGETFVWKMRTLSVMDLADVMVEKFASGRDIGRRFVGKGETEKIHEHIMSQEEFSRAIELDDLYILFPLVDHLNGKREYENAKDIQDPVIVSNGGERMKKKEIKKLLEQLGV